MAKPHKIDLSDSVDRDQSRKIDESSLGDFHRNPSCYCHQHLGI